MFLNYQLCKPQDARSSPAVPIARPVMFEPEIETDCTLAARQPVEERQQSGAAIRPAFRCERNHRARGYVRFVARKGS